MTTRKKINFADATAALAAVAFLANVVTVLRTCSEALDIAKGAFEYRWCVLPILMTPFPALRRRVRVRRMSRSTKKSSPAYFTQLSNS